MNALLFVVAFVVVILGPLALVALFTLRAAR